MPRSCYSALEASLVCFCLSFFFTTGDDNDGGVLFFFEGEEDHHVSRANSDARERDERERRNGNGASLHEKEAPRD